MVTKRSFDLTPTELNCGVTCSLGRAPSLQWSSRLLAYRIFVHVLTRYRFLGEIAETTRTLWDLALDECIDLFLELIVGRFFSIAICGRSPLLVFDTHGNPPMAYERSLTYRPVILIFSFTCLVSGLRISSPHSVYDVDHDLLT